MTLFGQRENIGAVDRRARHQSDLISKPEAPRVFYHDKRVMLGGMLVGIVCLPVAYYLITGKLVFGSVIGSIIFVGFGFGITGYLSMTRQLDDNPEGDIRGFFTAGPWFLIGAVLGAGGYLWNNGVEWLWSYDLTNVDFQTGFQSVGSVSEADGLGGFLGKFTRLLAFSLGGGAVVKHIAIKAGFDGMSSENAGGQD